MSDTRLDLSKADQDALLQMAREAIASAIGVAVTEKRGRVPFSGDLSEKGTRPLFSEASGLLPA
jgi:hypothetical protein